MAKKEKGERDSFKLHPAGSAIKSLREEKGVSLNALSKKIGWNKSQLSRYENNQIGITNEAIEKIAQGLELPPLYVLFNCLKQIYPDLSEPTHKAGKLIESLIKELHAEQ